MIKIVTTHRCGVFVSYNNYFKTNIDDNFY